MDKQVKVVYFGSKISSYRNSKASMETLEPLLAEFCDIKSYSSKQNKIAKFADMIFHFFKHGISADKIIIDVFSTSAFYFAFIIGLMSVIFRKKYILFLRGGNLPARYQNNQKLVRYLFKKAYRIIAPSYYLKNFFESQGFTLEYIPNILELNQYTFKERSIVRPKILALRGFGKPYNPLMTLKAVVRVKEEIPSLELLLLGNSDEHFYEPVIAFIKENNLESIVTIEPKMPRAKWLELSAAYDIMISNPVIDNTPVSIIEGMALGMCIITTDVGGVPYLVENNKHVLFVPDNDEHALAEAIKRLLNDNTVANALSKTGREKAETFSWDNVKQQWQDLLLK